MIPDDLQTSLGSEPGGVFYLHGDDEFRKAEAARALVEAHLDETTRDFNLDRLRGGEIDLERLASVLGTPPMMAEWRVVVLRETEALAGSKRARDHLLQLVASPPPGLVLILLCTVPERSSAKFYRELAARARSVEFNRIGENDLPGWLMDRCRDVHGVEMEEDAARALAQGVGSDLDLLSREMEKLSSLVEEGSPVTLEHVQAAGTRIPTQDRWAWLDLVGGRRVEEALAGLDTLLGHGESGVGLVSALGTHFLRLGLRVAGGSGALREALPRHQQWLARRYDGQARHWTEREVAEALEGLLRVDQLLKASGASDLHLLETWILERALTREAA
ncbi:MAG: DNA polymerase III subunit delta [Gemmatimonadales bacterium]|nr:MAG: DNA polymerase III subunit delta [Gemmatimonadales bacterium]